MDDDGIIDLDNPGLAQEISRLCHERLSQRPEAAETMPTGDWHYDFQLVGDGYRFVCIERLMEGDRLDGYHLMVVNGRKHRLAHVTVRNNSQVRLCYLDQYDLPDLLGRLELGHLYHRMKWPYGYLDEDGRVTMVWWINLHVRQDEAADTEYASVSGKYFVKDGHVIPPALRNVERDTAGYWRRVWELFDTGRIIDLKPDLTESTIDIQLVQRPWELSRLAVTGSNQRFDDGDGFYVHHPADPDTGGPLTQANLWLHPRPYAVSLCDHLRLDSYRELPFN